MSGSHSLSDSTGAASSSQGHHALVMSDASRSMSNNSTSANTTTPHTPSASISLSNQYSASPTSPATPSNTAPAEPITQAELLSLVLDLKLKAGAIAASKGANNNTGSSSSTRQHTPNDSTNDVSAHTQQSASISETSGIDTIDLCHRKIGVLPDELVNLIKGDVIRLALGYNVIARLPDNFHELSKLRYLNIRANMITTFPSVLCELPSLEILDISRNKIRKMPSEPGRLLNLRVLSIANNRLRRLPAYIGQMRHLRILKVEQNPIQWPPASVSIMPPTPKVSIKSTQDGPLKKADKEAASAARKKAEDRHMADWIGQLKSYLGEHSEPASAGSNSLERKNTRGAEEEAVEAAAEERSPPVDRLGKASGEVPSRSAGEAVEEVSSWDATAPWQPAVKPSLRQPVLAEAMTLPKSAPAAAPVPPQAAPAAAAPAPPPAIPLPPAPAPAPAKAFERIASPPPPPVVSRQVAPVPPVPAQFSPASSPQVGTPEGGPNEPRGLVAPKQHGRNNSHSVGQQTSYAGQSSVSAAQRRGMLRNKKSLPELRASPTLAALAAQEQQIELQQEDHEDVEEVSSSYEDRSSPIIAMPPRRPPLPHSASAFSGAGTEPQPSPMHTHARKMSLPGDPATGVSASVNSAPARRAAGPRGADVQASRDVIASDDSGTVEVERNSYFKRLSTLPPSTISKAVPVPVLKFVDATRGVLYALSQIYTALKQYILFATDDRLSGQFNRALDVASGSMGTLINSLDRFDSLSRRGTPEPGVIRGVLTAGRHGVVTFRKVVSVLQVQLRALQSTADVRYTRTLLLMLYGSMAEVSASWAVMAPQIDAVLPYLAQTREEATSAQPVSALHVAPSLPSIAEATSPGLNKTARPAANSASAANRTQRRRHAGSFSAQDVAQGANIAPGAIPAFDHAELAAARRSVRAAAPAALGTLPNAMPITPASGWGTSTTFDEAMSSQQADILPTTPNGVSNAPYTAGAVPGSYFNGFQAQAGAIGMSAPATSTRFPGLGSRSVTESPLGPGRNRRTPSTVSAGDAVRGMVPITPGTAHSVGSAAMPPMTPFTPYAHATQGRTVIDGHLVELVAQVTSVASGVWTAMLEHLASLGVRGVNATSPTPDSSAFPPSATQGLQRTRSRSVMSPSDGGSVAGDELGGAGASRRLRELRDLCVSTGDLTRRLQSTLDKVQEEAEAEAEATGEMELNCSAAESRRLVEQAAHFVKAIIAISQQVKSSSVEYPWPKPLLRSLGELMSCARDLTIHLHVLAPTTSAGRATPVPHPVVQAVQPMPQQWEQV